MVWPKRSADSQVGRRRLSTAALIAHLVRWVSSRVASLPTSFPLDVPGEVATADPWIREQPHLGRKRRRRWQIEGGVHTPDDGGGGQGSKGVPPSELSKEKEARLVGDPERVEQVDNEAEPDRVEHVESAQQEALPQLGCRSGEESSSIVPELFALVATSF